MFSKFFALLLLMLLLTSAVQAQAIKPADAARELAEMYADDQEDQREWETAVDRDDEFSRRQLERRTRVLEILAVTELEDIDAWDHAAGLLLHGELPGDYLLAHVLSIPPGAENTSFGRFTTAAALDRYLVMTNREQVFGTQMFTARPESVEYEEYPEHYMPEHLRQLFKAGPALRVKKKAGKPVKRAPKVPELKALARAVAKLDAEELATDEQLARARAIIHANAKLKGGDLLYGARVLMRSNKPADLLLAHVCACGAVFESKRKARTAALELCTQTMDRWLGSLEEAPRFRVEEGAAAPNPELPKFVKQHFLGE